MRVIIQRVSQAEVSVDGEIVGKIASGMCVFIGICHNDTEQDVDYIAKKVAKLRIFPDNADKMSKSIFDVGGEILVISQFTLYGACVNGCRPDFTQAASPKQAEILYDKFICTLEKILNKPVQCGRFRAMMQVHLVNDGPVTLIIDSKGKI